MPRVLKFTSPITVGQYPDQVQVSKIKLVSISVNYQEPYASSGVACMALVLEDVDTGHQFTSLLWKDATSLTLIDQFLDSVNAVTGASFEEDLLNRCSTYTDPTTGVAVIPPGAILVILTATPDAASRVYGDANPTFTGTLTGVLSGDGITATYTSPAVASTSVGVYSTSPNFISATLNDPNNKLSGYYPTLNTAALTITPAPLTVTPSNATRAVGAANPTFTGTITGIKNGDNITATYSSAANASTPAGTYSTGPDAISATLVDPDNKLGNYSVTLNQGTLTIT